MRVGIIGAGMSGLACANLLTEAGHEVALFDKGRGPGGRMATRRAEVDGELLHFDHGAQYFTAQDERFSAQLALWEASGVTARWPIAGDHAWVGTPGMNAPVKAMAANLDVTYRSRVESFHRIEDGWQLRGDGVADDVFDAICVAVPAEQAAPLLALHLPHLSEFAEGIEADPCWTVLVAFDGLLDYGHVMRSAGAIGWACRNSAKPGRADSESWVLQANPQWSRDHLEDEPAEIVSALLEELQEQVGSTMPAVRFAAAHRWRFGLSGAAGTEACWEPDWGIGVCGDWLIGPRVESAYLSGLALAEQILTDG